MLKQPDKSKDRYEGDTVTLYFTSILRYERSPKFEEDPHGVDAGGPTDGLTDCGTNGARVCGASTAYNFLANTSEAVPHDLSVPGAAYCAAAGLRGWDCRVCGG